MMTLPRGERATRVRLVRAIFGGSLLAAGLLGAAFVTAGLFGTPLAAQEREQLPTTIAPDAGGMILSMGQPPVWKWYANFSAGSYGLGSPNRFVAYSTFGVFRDIGSPVANALGYMFEGYFGGRGGDGDVLDGGLRAVIGSPFLRFFVGFDYNVPDDRGDVFFRFKAPITRGGFLVRGGTFQFDWLPWRGHTLLFGMTFPLNEPWRGRSRPRNAHQSLSTPEPGPLDYQAEVAALEEALANVRERAHWINRLTVPFLDHGGGLNREKGQGEFRALVRELDDHMNSTSALFPSGQTPAEEQRVYHLELDRAFSIAVSGRPLALGESTDLGRTLSARARQVLLDEVIFPYDRLLGQYKKKNTSKEFAFTADQTFRDWVASSRVREERREAVQFVFHELLDIVESEREFTSRAYGDSRLGWIPVQFGMRVEEYDTREELNELVARAVGHRWTYGNSVWYVQNAQWMWEFSRSVREAEDYHVLWIHDIAPFNAVGEPDRITYEQMVEVYLRTLKNRILEYDQTGVLPVYMIIFDQHYYEIKGSRKWMNVLEDPTQVGFPFPDTDLGRAMRLGLEAMQDSLRMAIAGSERLQSMRERHGDDWLHNRTKIHISITNPADPNYWTNQVLPMLGYPDNIMRDHRKIAFYDITEEDPFRGQAIYTGMGIGEHYVGATWEDRAIMAEGPGILNLKYSAQRVLLSQGFTEDEIPWPLKTRPRAADYDDIVDAVIQGPRREYQGMAMQLHNMTGFADKPINVAKAVLYSMMPPGSVIILPDSLWNSSFFAALLVGNCLRGARVMVIAPSLKNAPGGEGFPQMSRAQELFDRLIEIQHAFGEHMEATGGFLRTGIYDVDFDVADIPAAGDAVAEGLRTHPWLAEMTDFSEEFYDFLEGDRGFLQDYEVNYTIEDAKQRAPQLHLKANYFATRQAWSSLLRMPEFTDYLKLYVQEMAELEQDRENYTDLKGISDRLREEAFGLMEAWRQSVSEEEFARAQVYLMVGSANQDYRSMFMDGEAGFLVAGAGALSGLFDMLFLIGSATWVETWAELDALLPEYSGFKWWIGRLIRTAL